MPLSTEVKNPFKYYNKNLTTASEVLDEEGAYFFMFSFFCA